MTVSRSILPAAIAGLAGQGALSRKGNPSRHINRNVAVMASAASRLLRAYTTYPAMMDESRNVRIDQTPAALRDRLASQLLTACGGWNPEPSCASVN